MALRRVRSKTEPHFDSVIADETIARWPDDWELIEDAAPAAPASPPAVSAEAPDLDPARPRSRDLGWNR